MKQILLLAFAAPLAFAQNLLTPGFDIGAMDTSVSPCQDFYRYACGTWIRSNPVPSDQSSWGRFNELAERNRAILKKILEQSAQGGASRDAVTQKTGDFYAACMDEAGIEGKGIQPIRPYLDKIAAMKSNKEIAALVGAFHREGIDTLLQFYSSQDAKESTKVIAETDQGGLGLPDRDYYLKTDAKSQEIREKYAAFVARMFELAGDPAAAAAAKSKTILEFETALAKASLDRVTRRNPEKLYHKMSWAQFRALSPSFLWNDYLRALSGMTVTSLNVAVPDFVKGVEGQVKDRPLADWKVYLSWAVLRDAAPLLPKAFVEQNHDFYGKTLTGAQELRPRWKRCADLTDNNLGEALGQKYVQDAFAGDSKSKMKQMVAALEKALEADIKSLPWMTEETKKQALGKLAAIANKIGYPDKWRDYSTVAVRADDAIANVRAASRFEVARRLAKIGKPVDRNEWQMTPPTVNAYYDPQMNDINFPAGILQPPFFDPKMDDGVNYGGIGAVIGHELTHGFDDQGRQFDAKGNLRDWWTVKDGDEFKTRAACIDDQYSGFTAVADVHLNGKLTLGENVADNGGLRIAYMALLDTLKEKSKEKIDGFTAEQRLFLGWGQIWCQNITEEGARMRAAVDPHAPGRYRVNGVVSNMPEFQQAFGCKQGDAMARPNACRVW